jgi:hypothetical protein
MEPRTRTQHRALPGGKVFALDSEGFEYSVAELSYEELRRDTYDYYHKTKRDNGLLPPSYFWSETIERLPMIMSRPYGFFRLHNVAIDTAATPGLPFMSDWSGLQAENRNYARTLLARTNPFRTEFSVPVFTRELVDLATLFNFAAKTFAGLAGGNALNYKFGLLPFIDDVRKLHRITEAIERRMREISSLISRGGLRRKVQLDFQHTSSNSWRYTYTVWGVVLSHNVKSVSSCKTWASVRWFPKKDFVIPLDGISNFNLACRKVFDLEELDGYTIWNMVPFSWLIDYFADVSELQLGAQGQSEIRPDDICIMREHKTVDHLLDQRDPDVFATLSGPGITRRTVKYRDTVTDLGVEPTYHGILTQGQYLTILELLASFRR